MIICAERICSRVESYTNERVLRVTGSGIDSNAGGIDEVLVVSRIGDADGRRQVGQSSKRIGDEVVNGVELRGICSVVEICGRRSDISQQVCVYAGRAQGDCDEARA